MITHAAFPKTLLYCFIGPLPMGGLLLYKENHALDAWFKKAYGGEQNIM